MPSFNSTLLAIVKGFNMQPYRTIRSRSCAVEILFAAVFFCIGSCSVILAQTPEVPPAGAPSFLRYGLFGGVVVNNHSPNFSDFANATNSPSIVPSGFGPTFGMISSYVGGLVEVPVIERFGVSLRASVTNVGGFTLVGRENLAAPNPTGSGLYNLQISHALTVNNLLMFSGEPYLTYRVLGGLTLYAGARFGFMSNPTYAYMQTIPDDSPIKFLLPNGQLTSVWNSQSGTIPQVNSVNTALSGGVSLETPIDQQGHWFLAVEAFYMHGLTQVANGLVLRRPLATNNGLSATRTVQQNELGTDKDPLSPAWPSEIVAGSWLFNNLRAGISLRYAP